MLYIQHFRAYFLDFFYPVFEIFDGFFELFGLFFAELKPCLIEEDVLYALEEFFPHAVVFCLVAEAAAGLEVVQIIGSAF